jgi:energy-coupling factor transporter transmembrane protein EcfT
MTPKTSLIILGITALIFSRTMLVCFDDPEGPNLLIVTVMAVGIYVVALLPYRFYFRITTKLWLAILIQVFFTVALYFGLR